MTEAAQDPFAGGANPFTAIGYAGGAAPSGGSDPFAGGKNPFADIGTYGQEPKQSQKSLGETAADVAKSAGTGLAKGVVGLPGMLGDIKQLSDYVGSLPGRGLEKMGVLPPKPDDPRIGSYLPNLPTSADIQHGFEGVAGKFYEPQTPAGKFAETVGEFVPAIAIGSGGTAAQRLATAVKTAIPSAAGSELAGAATRGTEYEPAARFAGAITGGAIPAAIGETVGGAVNAVRNAVPPMTSAGREAAAQVAVGREIAQTGGGAPAIRQALAESPNIVPGSEGTLAQRAPQLAQWEDVVRTQNKGPFIQRAAEQNAARVEHLSGLQTEGNPLELTEGFKAQRAAVDQATQARIDQAQRAAEANRAIVEAQTGEQLAKAQEARTAALDALRNASASGSPQDAAAYFRQIRESLHTDAEAAIARAQAASETAQKGAGSKFQNVEEAGRAIREPAAEALAARKEADNALYAAAKIPDSATVSGDGIRAKVDEIRKGMVAEDRPIAGEEKRLFDLAGGYGEQVSFNRLKSLRSAILDESAATRRDNPAAYRRLNMLRGAVEDAMDHAVENQAAIDNIAVARGAMAQSDSIGATLARQARQYLTEQTGRTAVGAGGGSHELGAGQSTSRASGLSGTKRQGDGGPGGLAGAEGVSGSAERASSTPITVEQVGALKRANASYREQRETFGEGPIGSILEKKPRGADFELSNAEVPKKIFHPGDTGADDVRAYIKAVGEEKATPVLNDLAAFMLNEKAFTNGVPDPKKISAWLDSHKTALSALPPEIRSKFETVASAQKAVDEAFTAKRQRIDEFDRSAAARVAGLDNSGDIVQTIGGIIGQKDGAKIMGDLVAKAKGNEAAANGIKQAVVEHILDKFVPDVSAPRINAMRDFLASKSDVLASAGFSPAEISALDKRASAVTQSEQAAKEAAAARETGVKQAKVQGEAAVKETQAARSAEMDKYETGVVGRLIGANGTNDILDTIKGVFYGTNPAAKMADLTAEAQKIQGGVTALHKAIAQMLEREFTSTAEAGATGTMALKGAPFQKFVRDKADIMKTAGLSDEQIGRLSAIVQDQQRAARSINNAKLAGQSATTPDMLAAMRRGGTGTILSELANEQAVQLSAGAAGAATHGIGGGAIGILGTKLYGALREAGLARVNELRVRAALDPDFALSLLEKVPQKPDTGGAALVALRARQMSLAGAQAANRKQQ